MRLFDSFCHLHPVYNVQDQLQLSFCNLSEIRNQINTEIRSMQVLHTEFELWISLKVLDINDARSAYWLPLENWYFISPMKKEICSARWFNYFTLKLALPWVLSVLGINSSPVKKGTLVCIEKVHAHKLGTKIYLSKRNIFILITLFMLSAKTKKSHYTNSDNSF